MSEPLAVEYLELIKERWARWAAAGLPVSKDRQDLMAEVERLRGEVARQAEQITAVQAPAGVWAEGFDAGRVYQIVLDHLDGPGPQLPVNPYHDREQQ